MTANREKNPGTIDALKEWREKRGFLDVFDIIRRFDEDEELEITEVVYNRIRDFLIVELIIPNGQRPGVICGMRVDEIERAKTNITSEGLHKLFVSDHKTGYISSAMLFIYPNIYNAAIIYIHKILPKLTIFTSGGRKLTGKSHTFLNYDGSALHSSRITPLLRKFLLTMGIEFIGTITDFRKAAATLTGKIDPNLHKIMAVFLGHSRKAHDRYYRIQLGHDGLSQAFKNLEIFQTNPDASLPSPPIANDPSYSHGRNINSLTLPSDEHSQASHYAPPTATLPNDSGYSHVHDVESLQLSSNSDDNSSRDVFPPSAPLENKACCSQRHTSVSLPLSSDERSQLYPPSEFLSNEAICSQSENDDCLLLYSDEQYLHDISIPSSNVSTQQSINHRICSPIRSDTLSEDVDTSSQIEDNTNLRSFSINLTREIRS